MSAECSVSILSEGLLEACRLEGATVALGEDAFRTWSLARVLGWDAVAAMTSRRTWFRHLAILRRAGVPVPTGYSPAGPSRSECLMGRGWFRGGGAAALVQDPGRMVELLHRRFVVVDAWHRHWPVGTVGEVDTLLFRGACWQVGFEFEGVPGGYDELAIEVFLKRTAPVEGGNDA